MSIDQIREKINPVREKHMDENGGNGHIGSQLTRFSNGVKSRFAPYLMLILSIISGGTMFTLGRLSTVNNQKTPININHPKNVEQLSTVVATTKEFATPEVTEEVTKVTNQEQSGEVIGSKGGRKYYFPWCGTVKRIKPENRVYFRSIAHAKSAGFSPGGNCKGLY